MSQSKSRGVKRPRDAVGASQASGPPTTRVPTAINATPTTQIAVSSYQGKDALYIATTGETFKFLKKGPKGGAYNLGFTCDVCLEDFDAGIPWWNSSSQDCCVSCQQHLVTQHRLANAAQASRIQPIENTSDAPRLPAASSSASKSKSAVTSAQSRHSGSGTKAISTAVFAQGPVVTRDEVVKGNATLARGPSLGLLPEQLKVMAHPSLGGEQLQRVSYLRLCDLHAQVHCTDLVAAFIVEGNTKGLIRTTASAIPGHKQTIRQHCLVVEGVTDNESGAESSYRAWCVRAPLPRLPPGSPPPPAFFLLEKHWDLLRGAPPFVQVEDLMKMYSGGGGGGSELLLPPNSMDISRVGGGANSVARFGEHWKFLAHPEVMGLPPPGSPGQDGNLRHSLSATRTVKEMSQVLDIGSSSAARSHSGGDRSRSTSTLKSALRRPGTGNPQPRRSITNLVTAATSSSGSRSRVAGGSGDRDFSAGVESYNGWMPMPYTGVTSPIGPLDHAPIGITGSSVQLLYLECQSSGGEMKTDDTKMEDLDQAPRETSSFPHSAMVVANPELASQNPHLLCFFLSNGTIQCVDLHRRVELIFSTNPAKRPTVLDPSLRPRSPHSLNGSLQEGFAEEENEGLTIDDENDYRCFCKAVAVELTRRSFSQKSK